MQGRRSISAMQGRRSMDRFQGEEVAGVRSRFPRLFYHSEGEGDGRCEAAIDSEERTDGGEGRSILSSQIDLVLKNWETGRVRNGEPISGKHPQSPDLF